MDERRKAAWEDLAITKEELNRLRDALKKDEFRKLLTEYAEEINDPANKKLFENEIIQLERERGVDCVFVNPDPGYVIKTSIDGKQKAFINVCMSGNIGKPASAPSKNSSGARGLTWTLPYSQAPPRDDLDKKKVICTVFDVVFHPDSHHLSKNNPEFKSMMTNTAMDAVEETYHVKLDRKNIRFPKMSYKGSAQSSVIRKKSSNPPPPSEDGGSTYPLDYPYKLLDEENSNKKPQKATPKKNKQEKDTPFTTPKYDIKYRTNLDIQDWTNDRDCKMNAVIPKELLVSIFLPLLNSTADVTLDVNERWVQLKSTKVAKYFVHVPLPYAVLDQQGNAKFDQSKRILMITLPVKRANERVCDFTREDSGIESDGPHVTETECEDTSSIEEPLSTPKVQVLSEYSSDQPERTKAPTIVEMVDFLNPDIHYSPAAFACNVIDNVMAFTLHVKNVEPDSVKYVCEQDSIIHVRFSSMGSGFFPQHYAFYVKLPSSFTFARDDVSVEAWDNNVIVQLFLNPCDAILTEYYVGTDFNNATNQHLHEPAAIVQKLAELDILDEDDDVDIEVSGDVEELSVEVSSKETLSDAIKDQVVQVQETKSEISPVEVEKPRYYSESSGEEFSLESGFTKRGILKCRSVNRSLSESNVDDFSSSSLDTFSQGFGSDSYIPEEGEEEAIRKTVRFNPNIVKKTFRLNSSILGQQKKNLRKHLGKKRAQERRASESENSEADVEKVKNKMVEELAASSPEEDSSMTEMRSFPETQSSDQSNQMKANKCKQRRGKKKKPIVLEKDTHQSLNNEQLGFKNDLMFDLDM